MTIIDYLRHVRHVGVRNLRLYRIPLLWDMQYRSGRWRSIGSSRRPKVVTLAEKYAAGGAVVELAAGEGTLLCALEPASYSSYSGFDISREAIGKAKAKIAARGLTNCHFEVGDMVEWPGDNGISLVILEECLYYLPRGDQRSVVSRAVGSLKAGGAALITFHSKTTHRDTIDNCLSLGFPSELIEDGESAYLRLFSER